jgi:hypothetical protein
MGEEQPHLLQDAVVREEVALTLTALSLRINQYAIKDKGYTWTCLPYKGECQTRGYTSFGTLHWNMKSAISRRPAPPEVPHQHQAGPTGFHIPGPHHGTIDPEK